LQEIGRRERHRYGSWCGGDQTSFVPRVTHFQMNMHWRFAVAWPGIQPEKSRGAPKLMVSAIFPASGGGRNVVFVGFMVSGVSACRGRRARKSTTAPRSAGPLLSRASPAFENGGESVP